MVKIYKRSYIGWWIFVGILSVMYVAVSYLVAGAFSWIPVYVLAGFVVLLILFEREIHIDREGGVVRETRRYLLFFTRRIEIPLSELAGIECLRVGGRAQADTIKIVFHGGQGQDIYFNKTGSRSEVDQLKKTIESHTHKKFNE
jgi:hypothetical protein